MSAFGSQAFVSDAFASQAFGPNGSTSPVSVPQEYGGRQFYEDRIKQRRLNEQIMREDHDMTEFLRTLLSKGIL